MTASFRIAQLCGLMFLQFFIWSSWSVTLGLVLQTRGMGHLIAASASVGPVASVFGSFLLGMLAVRLLAPRLLLAALHFCGGFLLLAMPSLLSPPHDATFVWLLLAYMMLYMPTVGVANTVALKSLGQNMNRFPFVRAFGTLGWIVAGIAIGWAGLSASATIFVVAAAASFLLGGYSLLLPHVANDAPTDGSMIAQLFCTDAFGLMRDRQFLLFILCATLISVPLAIYYAYTSAYLGAIGIGNVSGVMALGQMSELLFMFSMPALYRRFGIKPLLLAGMIAWAVRYALFAIGDGGAMVWAVYLGILLHGICYDFFFVAGAIYTGVVAEPFGVNGRAQGMLTLFTYGIGMLLGSQVGGVLYARILVDPDLASWHRFWILPAIAAALIALLFLVLFKDDRRVELPAQR